MLPYTYVIGWSNLDKFYYGVRTANIVNPQEDLWKEYFTSSSFVDDFRKNHGEPDTILIDKIFTVNESAILYEYEYIKNNKLHLDEKWLNRACWPVVNNKGKPATGKNAKGVRIASNKGIPHTEKTKRKMSESKKGKRLPPFSAQHRRRLSESHKGLKQTPKTIKKKADAHRGMKRSDESKLKMSQAAKGKPKSEDHKKSMSRARKGQIPWNKGKKEDPKVTKKRSIKLTGRKMSKESSEKKSIATKGRSWSESRRKAFENGKKIGPKKGTPWSPARRLAQEKRRLLKGMV